MNDKIKDIVVTIIFLFTIISLFLINVIKKDTDISIAERRKLATMPELTTKSLFDGTYFKKFDSYVTDQFVERDAFRKIKIDIELSTKGEYNNLYLYDDYIIHFSSIRHSLILKIKLQVHFVCFICYCTLLFLF